MLDRGGAAYAALFREFTMEGIIIKLGELLRHIDHTQNVLITCDMASICYSTVSEAIRTRMKYWMGAEVRNIRAGDKLVYIDLKQGSRPAPRGVPRGV